MLQRLLFAGMTLAICCFAALVGLTLADRSSRAAVTGVDEWAGYKRPPGSRAPEFRLKDQDGKPVTSEEYRGRPFAITFVFSTCEDTCPALVDQVRGALDDTGIDMPLLALSVDPKNDTPARARKFLAQRRMTGRARFLLGSKRELQPVWNAYGVQPETDDLEHSAGVVLVDAQGRQQIGFPHGDLTPELLAHDMQRLTGQG